MPKTTRGSHFWTHFQSDREIGNHSKRFIGAKDNFSKRLYSVTSVRKEFIYSYDDETARDATKYTPFHGGVFNLSYSPNGSVVVAATERKSLLIFDPLRHRLISTIRGAHSDSVNYVKFLDDRLFATCSDDFTVAIWDLRNTRHKLKNLRGHSYWVKNIEYDSSKGLLLSSSYDGCVNMWDINGQYGKDTGSSSSLSLNDGGDPSRRPRGMSFAGQFQQNAASSGGDQQFRLSEADSSQTENVNVFERILYLSCIMRMRLTPDSSKMVVCTSEGYIMVIHDLNLETLVSDLEKFQSDLYRLMQKGHSCGLDFGSWFNRLFTAKQNRIELISDFPAENEAHSITSLDVHPHTWAILSRNISRDELSEWSCVHDIQGDRRPSELVPVILPKENIVPFCEHKSASRVTLVSSSSSSSSSGSRSQSFDDRIQPQVTVERVSNSDNYDHGGGSGSRLPFSSSLPSSFASTTTNPVNSVTASSPPMEMHVSPVVIISARTLNRRAHATILNPNTSYRPISPDTCVYRNISRLTNFIPEMNVGQGFIKELCFSPDGRLICSPYDHGYRILAFNEGCAEMSDMGPTSMSTEPRKLHEVRQLQPHSNYVVTTKFSPTHPIIASGCLSGRVVFSQPHL